jgi:hypothetical protein
MDTITCTTVSSHCELWQERGKARKGLPKYCHCSGIETPCMPITLPMTFGKQVTSPCCLPCGLNIRDRWRGIINRTQTHWRMLPASARCEGDSKNCAAWLNGEKHTARLSVVQKGAENCIRAGAVSDKFSGHYCCTEFVQLVPMKAESSGVCLGAV